MPTRNPGLGWRFIGFWERDRDFYLRAMATNIYFIQQGPPGSLSGAKAEDLINAQAKKGFYIFSAMLLPSLSGIAKRDATTHAELRNTVAALAVERWRLAHPGTLPESLADLVPAFLPAVPEDPFNGKPLIYKKLHKGYRIYSVGPNQRDDDGKEAPPHSSKLTKEQRENFDIVFTVER